MPIATLNGQVTPNSYPVTAFFQYGLTTGYGFLTSPQNFPAGSQAPQNFFAVASGLAASTLYHYRSVLASIAGTSYGADQTFMTPGCGGSPTCGSGTQIKIDSYVDGLFGTYAGPVFTPLAWPAFSANPVLGAFNNFGDCTSFWDFTNPGASPGYVKTLDGVYFLVTGGGLGSGKYYPTNCCDGSVTSSPPVLDYSGTSGPPFTLVYSLSPATVGGSPAPAWDGKFNLTDESAGGLCAKQTVNCDQSFGGLWGWQVILLATDPGMPDNQFYIEISGPDRGPTFNQPYTIFLWEGLLAAPVDPDSPLGTYTWTGFGGSSTPPATIDLVLA